jgi:hypothetical protein
MPAMDAAMETRPQDKIDSEQGLGEKSAILAIGLELGMRGELLNSPRKRKATDASSRLEDRASMT